MKYDKFFELAKEAGLQDAEIYVSTNSSLNFSLFRGEVVSFENNSGCTILARGLKDGKVGSAIADSWNKGTAKFLIDAIVANAGINQNDDPVLFFEGSKKYHKIKTYNPSLANVTLDEKMAKAKELESLVKNGDPRIAEVEVTEYSEQESSVSIYNTKGLKLSQKSNYFYYVCAAMASDGTQSKSAYDFLFENDFSKIDIPAFAKKLVEKAVNQLGGEACQSGKYKVVFSPAATSTLVSAYIRSASAEEVQRGSSLFAGKLNSKIANSKITIMDMPIQKTPFGSYFDDEGVAKTNKAIVKNGVLMTYLYNLTTAAKDGVESTANASNSGNKMGIAPSFLVLKPGKKTQEELFADVKEGVYLTGLTGMHAGLNPQSGNFSLQTTGYRIVDGKLGQALDVITVSGNLLKVFEEVTAVGSDSEISPQGVSTPSIVVKSLSIGGK